MIVTCSKCTKRFMVEDKLIPEAGRQVRCTVCTNVWRQFPDTPPLVKAPPFLNFSPAQEFIETRAAPKKRSKWVGLMIFIALLGGLASAVVLGHPFIVRLCPQAERLYSLGGLPLETGGMGLSISHITPLPQRQEGIDMLVITGEVKNTSGKSRHLSPLKIKVVKGSQATEQIVDQWDYIIPISVLLPGESVHFETEPRPRAPEGERVIVGF